jgi:hypothetical protein
MKNLKNNSTTAHEFFYNNYQDGKSSNLWFEQIGNVKKIYSYSSCIGAWFINQEIFFYYSPFYSSTTSKHQSLMLGAMPYNLRTFKVGSFISIYNDLTFESLLNESINFEKENLKDLFNKQIKAKKHIYFTQNSFEQLHSKLIEINELDKAKDFFTWFKTSFDFELININSEKRKKFLQAEKEKNKRNHEEKINKFLSYESNFIQIDFELLRLKKNELNIVETSKNIEIPKDVLLRYYNQWNNNELKQGSKILNFSVNSVSDSQIVIGCHKFKKLYVKQFINSLNN